MQIDAYIRVSRVAGRSGESFISRRSIVAARAVRRDRRSEARPAYAAALSVSGRWSMRRVPGSGT
jgi:hypothetical protein